MLQNFGLCQHNADYAHFKVTKTGTDNCENKKKYQKILGGFSFFDFSGTKFQKKSKFFSPLYG